MRKISSLKTMASRLRQVAPYLVQVDQSLRRGTPRYDVRGNTEYSLRCMARETGSQYKRHLGSDGKVYIHISDPLCLQLEQAGMNE